MLSTTVRGVVGVSIFLNLQVSLHTLKITCVEPKPDQLHIQENYIMLLLIPVLPE